MKNTNQRHSLASSITKAASGQTFYTIGFLVDRERVSDAYRAYAYFRWVDDTLDADSVLPTLAPHAHLPRTQVPGSAGESTGASVMGGSRREALRAEVDTCPGGQCQGAQQRIAFLARQKALLEACYRGESIQNATLEEQMLVELVQRDDEKNSGLQSYLRNMMEVMEFDANRRGRLISQAELTEYTRWLATAVTEAMHYFIGHCCHSPHDETRYLAVTAAHITHMLRDTFDDVQTGYYNIPREVLETNHIQPQDVQSKAYRAWVQSRVQLARNYFNAGREYLARVENPRCRLAGFAYTARFEWLLDTVERENYFLRPQYDERKRVGTGLQMGLSTLCALLKTAEKKNLPPPVVSQSLRKL